MSGNKERSFGVFEGWNEESCDCEGGGGWWWLSGCLVGISSGGVPEFLVSKQDVCAGKAVHEWKG